MKRIYLFIIILVILIPDLRSQTCTETLQTAQRNFDDGLLEGIPELISGCMQDGFTKEEMANAYKLLIQTYIYSEEIQKADEMMLQFLREFPSYSIVSNDPKEFIDLYNTYDTDPVFNIEAAGGLALSVPLIIENYSPVDIGSDPEEYYVGAGFAFELNYLNKLSKDFDYGIGISFLYASMGYYSEPYEYTALEATFWDMIVGLPISFRYNLPVASRLKLFGKFGLEPTYLLNYRMDFTRTDNIRPEPFPGNEIITQYQNRFDIRPIAGIGANFDIGRDFLAISINYKAGVIPRVKKQMRYSVLDQSDKYLYFDDDRISSHAILSVSYIRPIYNPRKNELR